LCPAISQATKSLYLFVRSSSIKTPGQSNKQGLLHQTDGISKGQPECSQTGASWKHDRQIAMPELNRPGFFRHSPSSLDCPLHHFEFGAAEQLMWISEFKT